MYHSWNTVSSQKMVYEVVVQFIGIHDMKMKIRLSQQILRCHTKRRLHKIIKLITRILFFLYIVSSYHLMLEEPGQLCGCLNLFIVYHQ